MQQRKFLLEPLPLGLLANAVLYGACMWIFSLVPPFLARRLGRSRNRCPACNYDRRGLAESAACPECGPIS